MNKFHILSLICLIAGIVFFILGILSGEVETGVFVVFPFISGSGIYAFLGFIFIIIAILLFTFGFAKYIRPDEFEIEHDEYHSHKKTSIKGGGVILIGPIPIVFGSNWKIALVLIIIAIILILVSYFTFRSL